MPSRILSVHLADGFADDCEELIHKCIQTDTLNYQIFCNIWKDMNFALVYQGRASGAEVAELSEEFLNIAKRYMLGNSSNFEESVAGLFLVYALLHLQPYNGFAALRITPADLEAIHCLEVVARRQKRHDVLYILGSVLVEGPVEWHLMERQYGLERQVKKVFDVTTSIDKVGVRPKGVFYRQNEELDIIRELSVLGRRYCSAKAAITGTTRPDRTLSYVEEHVANELGASLKLLICGKEGPPPDADKSRSNAIQRIKQRAMADTVHQMKHLQSNDDKNEDSAKASTSKCKPSRKKKRKIGTGRSGKRKSPSLISSADEDSISLKSPTKKYVNKRKLKNKTSNSKVDKDGDDDKNTSAESCKTDKRRKGKATNKLKGKRTVKAKNISPSKRNTRKRRKSISSSSNSTIEISDHDDDDDEISSDEKGSADETMDMFLQKLQNKTGVAESDVNESLPVKDVDQLNVAKEIPSKNDKEVDVESQKISTEGDKSDENISELEHTTVTDKNLEDKPKELSSPPLKALKRSALKAKLKRLGILQVADIEP